jgi:hypothetical protein
MLLDHHTSHPLTCQIKNSNNQRDNEFKHTRGGGGGGGSVIT